LAEDLLCYGLNVITCHVEHCLCVEHYLCVEHHLCACVLSSFLCIEHHLLVARDDVLSTNICLLVNPENPKSSSVVISCKSFDHSRVVATATIGACFPLFCEVVGVGSVDDCGAW
jgi:hypothetical protein